MQNGAYMQQASDTPGAACCKITLKHTASLYWILSSLESHSALIRYYSARPSRTEVMGCKLSPYDSMIIYKHVSQCLQPGSLTAI